MKKIFKTKIIPGMLTAAFIIGGAGAGSPMPNSMKPITKVQAEETKNIDKIILRLNKPAAATENVKIEGTEITTETVTVPYTDGMVLTDKVTCKGYTFKGWYIGDTPLSSSAYTSITITGADSITVDAKWEEGDTESSDNEDGFTITLDANGGTVSPETIEVNDNETILLPTPERENYIFDGWYIGDERITPAKTFSEDITLVAHWTKDVKYTMTFDTNGGKTTFTSITFRPNEEIVYPTPSRLGYDFTGWYVGNDKIAETYTYGEDVTAVAHWELKTYKITYENVDGWENTSPTSYTYGDAVTLVSPTKEGFVFDGWYEKESNQPVTGIGAGSAMDYTFVAKWHEETEEPPVTTVTLTFDTDGGDPISPRTISPEDTVWLPTPTKEGFIFDGWYVLGEKVAMFKSFDKNTTLVAHWTKKTDNTKTEEEKQAEITEKAKETLKTFTVAGVVVKPGSSIELPKGAIAAKDSSIINIPENGILTLSEGKYAIALPGVSEPYVFTVANSASEDASDSSGGTITGTNDSNTSTGADSSNTTLSEQDKNLLTLAKTILEGYGQNGVKVGDKVTLPSGSLVSKDGQMVATPGNVLTFDTPGSYAIVLPDGTRYIATLANTPEVVQTSTENTTTEAPKQVASLTKVKISKLTAGKKKVTVKFKKITGASGYEIQIASKKNMKKATTYTTKKTTYKLKKLKTGSRYYVRVRAYKNNADGTKTYGKWSAKKRTKKIK